MEQKIFVTYLHKEWNGKSVLEDDFFVGKIVGIAEGVGADVSRDVWVPIIGITEDQFFLRMRTTDYRYRKFKKAMEERYPGLCAKFNVFGV